MKKPKFICLYLDSEEQWKLITHEQRGRMLLALLAFAKDEPYQHLIQSSVEEVLFSFISSQIRRDFAKYADRCEQNRKNALSVRMPPDSEDGQ